MTHFPQLIVDLGLILIAGGITTLIFKKIKQPVVLGYILAGFLVGPHTHLIPTVADQEGIQIWSEIGIIFLLFSLGLEFSFKKLVKVGGSASITAITEIVIMIVTGYLAGKWMGWSTMDSIFLGAILSMSSTTIIIRAFEEVGAKTQKFASLVFGILIIEDLIAILLMVILSTIAVSQEFAGEELIFKLLKLLFFLIAWFLAGIFFIPTFLKRTRKLMNDETLVIVSLGLCLLMVIFSVSVGFSAALGAFIMGSILAETKQAERIEHLTKSVKDLFAAIFFVSVGMMIDPNTLVNYAVPVLIVTLLTIFGKFIATTAGALLSGQPMKQSVQSGMSLAQIGEFSFIIASLGVSLKVTSDFLYPITVAASTVTTLTTPYMIRKSESFYLFLEKILPKKVITFFNRYSSGSQQITYYSAWRKLLRSYVLNLVIHSVISLSIILLSRHYLNGIVIKLFGNGFSSSVITTTITLVLLIFPIWALAIRKINPVAYSHLWSVKRINRSPLIVMEIFRIVVAILLIGFLLSIYFSTLTALLIGILCIGITALLFSRSLQLFYERAEGIFLRNLNERENEKTKYQDLVPWDAHFATFNISPELSFVGRSLFELGFREKYGINIALISRGKNKIISPGRFERLFPGDKIVVIGTDEQLDTFKQLFETETKTEEDGKIEIVLKNFRVTESCALYNRSINGLSAHEKKEILIVGIERKGERILNPDSGMTILANDVVWVIGVPERLQTFMDGAEPQKIEKKIKVR